MGDNLYEPITNTKWEVTFNIPKGLKVDSTNQVEVADGIVKMSREALNGAFTKMSQKRFCKKIQNDINNLRIEFNCNTDTDAVRNWMNLWLEQAYKEDANRLMKYFEFRQDEKHLNEFAMVLKTPLNKLTEEEKKEIRDMLAEMTDIDVEQLNKAIK